MTVNYPKDKDEVTLAKDVLDELIAETEREDFDAISQPQYQKTEIPAPDEKHSDASFPNISDRRFKSLRIR